MSKKQLETIIDELEKWSDEIVPEEISPAQKYIYDYALERILREVNDLRTGKFNVAKNKVRELKVAVEKIDYDCAVKIDGDDFTVYFDDQKVMSGNYDMIEEKFSLYGDGLWTLDEIVAHMEKF